MGCIYALIAVIFPDSEFHGANMGPTWVLSAPDGPHVGPMNLTIRVVFVKETCVAATSCVCHVKVSEWAANLSLTNLNKDWHKNIPTFSWGDNGWCEICQEHKDQPLIYDYWFSCKTESSQVNVQTFVCNVSTILQNVMPPRELYWPKIFCF